MAQNHPVKIQLEKGKTYLWCPCGLTKKAPFCDGAHRGTGKKPQPFQAEETKEVHLCACGRTGTPPYCDGSHH